MTETNYDIIRKFALDYMNLQLILLNSQSMQREYQISLSNAIDMMKEYGKNQYGLVFDGDRINWKDSFPNKYYGEGSYSIEWLATVNKK